MPSHEPSFPPARFPVDPTGGSKISKALRVLYPRVPRVYCQECLENRKVLRDRAQPTGALGTARAGLLGAGRCSRKRDSGTEALGDKTGLGQSIPAGS